MLLKFKQNNQIKLVKCKIQLSFILKYLTFILIFDPNLTTLGKY